MRASRKPEAQNIVMKEYGIASGMETNALLDVCISK
jgi:hypothetical protein